MIFKKRVTEKAAKVGLCLGGGGAKGFAHVGALKAFEEEGIEFSLAVGTSVGSIVAALYCARIPVKDIIAAAERVQLSDLHGKFLIKADSATKIGDFVRSVIGDADIESLPIKYAAVATDLISAKQVVLDHGKVATAVSASAAVPLVYMPVEAYGMHLVDGGLTNNIPSDVCRMMGATKVVAIDVNPTRAMGNAGTGFFDVLKTVFNVMNANASLNGKMQADLLIETDTSQFKASGKDGYRDMIDLGYNAAKANMDKIKALFTAA